MNIDFYPELINAMIETLEMLAIGLSSALIFGGALGVFLYLWRPGGLSENLPLFYLVGGFINVVRSFPFVILLISIGPVTRTIAGTTIGPIAAAVPLSIAAITYFARLVEISLNDVPKGIIEAAQGMGATLPQIVRDVLLVEAKSSLILSFTSLAVSFISYSAAAGIVGGGGIGDLAIRYGYYRFQTDVMVVTVAGLVLLVQFLQFSGGKLASRYNRK